MSKKFRNSLFGFNRDDVMMYVLESKEKDENNKNKIAELSGKLESLTDDFNELTSLYEQTVAVLKEAEAQLDSFKQREEALTALSESIGRLYLVAEANAKAIIQSANDNAEKSQLVVNKSVEIAENAESDLAEISETLNTKTSEYTSVLSRLQSQLAETKRIIEENNSEIKDRKAELAEIAK